MSKSNTFPKLKVALNDNIEIETVPYFVKALGVWVNHRLKWDKHIS